MPQSWAGRGPARPEEVEAGGPAEFHGFDVRYLAANVVNEKSGKTVPVFGTDISTQLAEFLLADDNILQASTGQDPVGTAQGAYEMAKKAIAGDKNDPHAVELPGIVYDRTDPATVEAWLASAQ